MTVAIKDNICTSTLPTTCASNMLKDFTSPYDATVIQLLEQSGALVMGKTNMDEFGMGSCNVHSIHGPVLNPYQYKCDKGALDSNKRTAGGSSGGSAAAVAMEMCTIALGSDTGGSVRMPASYCGIVGFKPSYGRVSRYGLVSYANSLDTVGILSRSVEDCRKTYDIISQYDVHDPTSMTEELREELDIKDRVLRTQLNGSRLDGLVVGIPQEYYVDSLSEEVLEVWRKGIQHLRDLGAVIKSVSMPHTPLALPAYYIIALAEASSNLARYDGVRYGNYWLCTSISIHTDHSLTGYRSPDNKDQLLYEDTRTKGFGDEVQRRILLGTHVLTAGTYETLFLPAQNARRLIQHDFDSVFSQENALFSNPPGTVDVLLTPSAISAAPTLYEDRGVNEYLNDVMTLPANLAGIPAITIPSGVDKEYPIGLQLLGQYGYDRYILHIADRLSRSLGSI
ncbi:amidase signature domain-containing protein [Pilobolus umbonatus]|nr:amidase signature domain-containing protein [Pilobolus umbonatus]